MDFRSGNSWSSTPPPPSPPPPCSGTFERGNCELAVWVIVLLCVAAASLLVLVLVVGCRCARRKRRGGALGSDHAYFQSINNDDSRTSLMQRFMRQSQLPLLQSAESTPPVRISSRRRDGGGGGAGMGGVGLLPVTRSRSGTGADLGLIDNDNAHQVVINEDPIGCGAAGDVLVGVWQGQKVAIKQLQTMDHSLSHGEAETLLRSFEREVKVCCEAVHPNLVNFFGYTTKPKLCIYMELVEGGSLDHALYREKWRPTTRQVQSLVLDMARGMDYLHSQDPVRTTLSAPFACHAVASIWIAWPRSVPADTGCRTDSLAHWLTH